MGKFASRKLLLTSLTIALVAVVNFMGIPLDEASLEAMTTMVLGLVGAQGVVDTAAAWKAGKALSGAAKEVEAVVSEPEVESE